MTKRFSGRAAICLAAAMLPAMAAAQDTGPVPDIGAQTPPELRDFRLDTPPPRPAPEQPAPQPSPPASQPPPVTPTAAGPAQPRPTPRRETAATIPATTGESAAPTGVSADSAADQPLPLPAPSETAGALPTIAAEPEQTQTPAAAPLTPPFGLDWATLAAIGGCAALLAALVAVFAWWRNRARVVTEARFAEASLSQPSPPARLDKTRPAATPARTKAPEKQVAGELSVQFVPTNAQLSIASLTVTGKLTVANLTGANVGELALRSQMMSAQDGQREAIAAFHENRTDGEIQPLGDMVPGERIDAIIEIRLPRTELHAFRWTEREFVAPIVMVNVAGTAGGTPVEARLSQLIGRESTGTSRRMKPLAIDRGPKRYQGIEARPVFA